MKKLKIRASEIRLFLKSPMHYKLRSEFKETPSQFIGTAFHARFLEPKEFVKNYDVLPDNLSKKAIKEIIETYPDKIFLTLDQSEKIKQMFDGCMRHEKLKYIYIMDEKKKVVETTIEKEFDDYILHGTPDLVIPETNAVFDVKTTKDASMESFEKSIFNYMYMLQAAVYLRLTNCNNFYFIAVENQEPYNAAVYRLDQQIVDIGVHIVDNTIPKIVHAYKTNNFKGYQDDSRIENISIPKWAWNKLTNEY